MKQIVSCSECSDELSHSADIFPHSYLLTRETVSFQVMYKEKDSDTAPGFWAVEGNTSHSVQLSSLGKYVLYEIQVLAFTRIGDGRSSSPPILERTLDDGKQRKHLPALHEYLS